MRKIPDSLVTLSIFGFWALLGFGSYAIAPRAFAYGHTNIPLAAGSTESLKMGAMIGVFGANTPNYGVFKEGRYVYVITGLAPARIEEIEGKLVTVQTLLRKTLPVQFYRPARPEEAALWHTYFKE